LITGILVIGTDGVEGIDGFVVCEVTRPTLAARTGPFAVRLIVD
jgi:hypothetical protein